MTRGIWFALAFIVIYVIDGALIGWARAYEVLVGITSPSKVPYPALSWVLSLIGWMIIPAFIGGTTGYFVARQIDTHRSREPEKVLTELQDRAMGRTHGADRENP